MRNHILIRQRKPQHPIVTEALEQMHNHDDAATVSRLQEQYANREILIEDLRAGRYQEHHDGWHDDDTEKVCILGAAYETARQRIYPNAGLLPLKQALKDAEYDLHPLAVIARTYNFTMWEKLCLTTKSDHTDTTMPQFADYIEQLPPPSLPNFAKQVIIRLATVLDWQYDNPMADGPEQTLASRQHAAKAEPTVAEAKTDDRHTAHHGKQYWRGWGDRYQRPGNRSKEQQAQAARRH